MLIAECIEKWVIHQLIDSTGTKQDMEYSGSTDLTGTLWTGGKNNDCAIQEVKHVRKTADTVFSLQTEKVWGDF